MTKKYYCIDTSVLLDNPKAIEILLNGDENDIYITSQVFKDLDHLKKNNRFSHLVKDILDELIKYSHKFKIIPHINGKDQLYDLYSFSTDNASLRNPLIFVTNDPILTLRCQEYSIISQDFRDSNPYKSESETYTGIIDTTNDQLIDNCFYWTEGRLFYNSPKGGRLLDYDNSFWKIKPRTPYQNAAMELLLNPDLDITSIQSEAGFGKTYLALAASLYWFIEKKKFDKIYVFKHNIDVGNEKLGYLPGDLTEKTHPYFRPIYELLVKLHKLRPANKLFTNSPALVLDSNSIEFLPINFIRGMNIDRSFVIIDECQNFSREEMKIILSRMGEDTRVVLLGDVNQIDSPYLNQFNNGLNWCVQAFKGLPNFGHCVLKGKHSRGRIADMVRNSIL